MEFNTVEVPVGSQTLTFAPSLVHIVGIPLIILSTVAVGFVLVYLKEILVPFVVALFFVYLLRPVVTFLTREWDQCCRSKCRNSPPRNGYRAAVNREDLIVEMGSYSDEEMGVVQPEEAKSPRSARNSPREDNSSGDEGVIPHRIASTTEETKRGRLSRRPQAAGASNATTPESTEGQETQASGGEGAAAESQEGAALLAGGNRAAARRPRGMREPASCFARCMTPLCCGAAHCPRWFAVLVALSFAAGCLTGLALMVADAVQTFESEDLDSFVNHAGDMAQTLMVLLHSWFNLDGSNLVDTIRDNLPITNIVHGILSTVFDIVGNAFLIMLFVLYLLFEQSSHPRGR